MTTVAAAAGISPETLRKIERGAIPTPAFFTIAAIAEATGASLDAFADTTEDDGVPQAS